MPVMFAQSPDTASPNISADNYDDLQAPAAVARGRRVHCDVEIGG